MHFQQGKNTLSKRLLRRDKRTLLWKSASNSVRNWQKLQQFLQNLKVFMHFLSVFRKTWCLRTLKTFKKELLRGPGAFCQEIKAVLWLKKLKLRLKKTKTAEDTDFLRFNAIFVKYSRDFVVQNIVTNQQRTNSLFNRVVGRDKRSFEKKGCHNDTKIFKKSFFHNFWFSNVIL